MCYFIYNSVGRFASRAHRAKTQRYKSFFNKTFIFFFFWGFFFFLILLRLDALMEQTLKMPGWLVGDKERCCRPTPDTVITFDRGDAIISEVQVVVRGHYNCAPAHHHHLHHDDSNDDDDDECTPRGIFYNMGWRRLFSKGSLARGQIFNYRKALRSRVDKRCDQNRNLPYKIIIILYTGCLTETPKMS